MTEKDLAMLSDGISREPDPARALWSLIDFSRPLKGCQVYHMSSAQSLPHHGNRGVFVNWVYFPCMDSSDFFGGEEADMTSLI